MVYIYIYIHYIYLRKAAVIQVNLCVFALFAEVKLNMAVLLLWKATLTHTLHTHTHIYIFTTTCKFCADWLRAIINKSTYQDAHARERANCFNLFTKMNPITVKRDVFFYDNFYFCG